MSVSAVCIMIAGLLLSWGGAFCCIVIAWRKRARGRKNGDRARSFLIP
ncbi:MAG: MetS family NSS transporter small subunit [Spartobacteria bacterium]|nr:MetS family NSS transporter small subunit [Spartobacteria bacterium]